MRNGWPWSVKNGYFCSFITSVYVFTNLLRASIIYLKLTSAFDMATITSCIFSTLPDDKCSMLSLVLFATH